MGREGFECHPQHRTMENLNRCDNHDDRVIWNPDSLTLPLLVSILSGRNIAEMVGSVNRQQTSRALENMRLNFMNPFWLHSRGVSMFVCFCLSGKLTGTKA